jgi:hypothetical protein
MGKQSYDAGYEKGKESTRGQLLMLLAGWLEQSGGCYIHPAWLAHVAVEEFKCGCRLTTDYDGALESDYCEKWVHSTGEQQVALFKNVYGYDYMIYLERQKQAAAKRDAEYQKQLEQWHAQRAATVVDRLRAENINPDLLP